MKTLVALLQALEETPRTGEKTTRIGAALRGLVDAGDVVEARALAWLLAGGRLKRALGPASLRKAALEHTGHPVWLVAECVEEVGDLAETLALLVAAPWVDGVDGTLAAAGVDGDAPSPWPSLMAVLNDLQALAATPEPERRATLRAWWSLGLPPHTLRVLHKLLTGSLRVGVDHGVVVNAIATAFALSRDTAQRRVAALDPFGPVEAAWALVAADSGGGAVDVDDDRPLPFLLAHPWPGPTALGPGLSAFALEPKWDGVRCQLIATRAGIALWSRGDERLNEAFPDVRATWRALPKGTVLDGELLVWPRGEDQPASFAELSTRTRRKKPGPKILAAAPAIFLAYDVLRDGPSDVRALPWHERRARLEALVQAAHPGDDGRPRLSPLLDLPTLEVVDDWVQNARVHGVEGVMLKRKDAAYVGGRPTGVWWKHKTAPFTADAVLVYAQRGHGKRAGQYSDYGFAIWNDATPPALVPFARAYGGLTDVERKEVDRFVRAHTTSTTGPIRHVEPRLVVTLAFEDVAPSRRHQAGVAVRFPRMVHLRFDKTPVDADTVASIAGLARLPRQQQEQLALF